jgi:putative nucleotidyltransferase with HDIG domain
MQPTVAVDDLRPGMFIHMEGGWLSHPFPLSSFKLQSDDQIATIRRLGLQRVRWSPEKTTSPGAPSSAPGPAAALNAAAQQAAARRAQLDAQRAAQRQMEAQYGEAGQTWRDATRLIGSDPAAAGAQVQALAGAIVDKMLSSQDVSIRLVPAGGERFATHLLNVTVVSLLLGRSLGLSATDLNGLGTGTLLHDIGKLDLAERVRHLEDGATAAHIAAYREHVARGLQQGQRMALPPTAMAVIAQHHEQADGQGFPLHLAGDKIHIAARIAAVVNRYDNLCNPPLRTVALTPHEAVAMLFATGRNRFDPAVLNAFIKMMGVYPAGSVVQLTDDRFALVVGVNASRPLKPRVLVHDGGTPRGEALVLDLEQHPELGIRRSLAASKLPPATLQYLDPRPRTAYYFECLDTAAAACEGGARAPAEPVAA